MAPENELQVQETKQEVEETDVERTRARTAFVPQADIYETDQEIVVMADIPGVDENTIDITLEQGVLTINGTVDLAPPEGYSLGYAEYDVGDYQRGFRLSDRIDQSGIEATVKDGVLRLRLPKAQEAQTKKITVRSA